MDDVFCHSCGTGIDAGDNFCRHCGTPMDAKLPAIRQATLPAAWQPHVTPAMKGAAVMAAGTVGQFLFRRAVRGLIGGGRRSKRPPAIRRRREPDDDMVEQAQVITEMVMMRRVRVRRPS